MRSDQFDFQWVKSNFFPRWDREGKWTFETHDPERNCQGYCDIENKKIIACDTITAIHEVCHAVASTGHGKKWQQRMEKAAIRACDLGLTDLAEKIRQDYGSYSNGIKPNAHDIYNAVADAADAGLSSDVTIKYVAGCWGMKPAELLSRYRKVPSVYAEHSDQRQDLMRVAGARKPH